MTTIQIILLLCILVATVGLVIYFEKNAAKFNDSTVKIVEEKPLTEENIIKSLNRIGATEIKADEDGIMFLYQNCGY
jgi:cell division septal protein FtsQ